MTDDFEPTPSPRRRPRAGLRFLIAFLAGIIAVLGVGVGALYAYDRQYDGRILPGVRIGALDLSGLDPTTARSRLDEHFGHVARGRIVVSSPKGDLTLGYRELGRAPDVDTMLGAALAAGRESGMAALVGNARTALRGVSIGPAASLDISLLDAQLATLAAAFDREPVEATITHRDGTIDLTTSKDGQLVDVEALRAQLVHALSPVDAPAEVRVHLPLVTVEPTLSTADVQAAKAAAERMTADLDLTIGTDTWTITSARLKKLMHFSPTVDGGMTPIIDVAGLDPVVKAIARKVDRSPTNATYRTDGSRITGVRPSVNGRRLVVDDTRDLVVAALLDRVRGATTDAIEAKATMRKPRLTTEAAQAAIPRMKRVSTWTTWFPIAQKNGFGANIWLPAKFINGYTVAPGETFSFWKAVGTVSRARGFKQGGAIIDGRTQLQGALAGGICSCSTTLFNAAMRAGYKMGARRNHYYYIDRYPKGLDATVFQTDGYAQDMTWTNDTKYPVLIRGINTRNGGTGYVRFDLYTVPTGRSVSISLPTVRNFSEASDMVQYTSSLPAGSAQRVEFPVDGMDVWVTVTRKEHGKVLDRRVYYSHYSRITGITLIGRGGSGA